MSFLRLDSLHTTMVFDVNRAVPACCYWGPRLAADTPLAALQWQPVPPAVLDHPVGLNLLPETGRGWWGWPALSGCRGRFHWSNRFELSGCDASTNAIVFTLADAAAKLEIRLALDLDPDTGVLRQNCRLTNTGDDDYHLHWCAAAALPLPPDSDELLLYEGAWTKEFGLRRQPFPSGALVRDNCRGRTSHSRFPGVIAGQAGFDDRYGSVYGFHLGWSGNHRLVAEATSDGWRQVQLGELLMPGEMILAPGRSYTSPCAYACRAEGLNQLSQAWHRFLRKHILPAGVSRHPRPVQYNTWEAVYFDHRLQDLMALADRAADLGVERFVLDDGWFKGRRDDTRGLGDWEPDSGKFPDGLEPLISHVNRLGMSFGLWVEPEMVNPDSDLYRCHPDWVLHLDPLPRDTGRHQLVLDLARPEVSDYLFAALDGLLTAHPITYLKWDMNRDLTTAGHEGRAAYHSQVHALYGLVDRVRAAHPAVEIETCASGGGRVDFEILRRANRVWPSDSNDALERQVIQHGFSLFFPPEIMGCHVGPAVSHTTGRRLSLEFRGLTALAGHLGLELDLRELDAADVRMLKQIIAAYKDHRNLLHTGTFLRLNPSDKERLGWGVVGTDQREAVYGLFQLQTAAPGASPVVNLMGLIPGQRYRIARLLPIESGTAMFPIPEAPWAEEGLVATGQLLAEAGIAIPLRDPASGVLLKAVAV